ncbi:ABC transporter permease [Rubrivirga litoralis]|uniref:ABC transporter permease n=1 Tax=Rubrivirga litoralis TaxID=3075598 RepID=A0ABU3BMG4_9BACT|nr:ABC transporter permease [Rubrivirga sp. F394]MDT0630472.1 ABC transporter permease [Rubrivirga sp. F394]
MVGLLLLTLRELRARKVVVGLFVVATLVWVVLAFALQLDVVDGSLAGARLFGQDAGASETLVLDGDGRPVIDPVTGEPMTEAAPPAFGGSLLESLVFGAQTFVAGAAYWIGILLALFATGGLVASLVERGGVDVLLTKPLSRSKVLAGRLAGVWVVMLALTVYLFGAVWLVMSIKSGIWNPRFLLAIGAVFGMFAVLYGVVALVGVWSGSAPLSLIATLALLFVTLVLAIPNLADQVSRVWRPLVVGLYAVLPKFGSVGTSLVPQLATGQPVASLTPLLSSLAFGAVCYAGAFALFSRKDY